MTNLYQPQTGYSYRYHRYLDRIKALYQKKKVRVYTSIVLSLLTVSFFSFFAIRPTLVTISGLLKNIKDKKDVLERMDQKITNLTKARDNYNQLKDRFYLIDHSLPQDPALSSLVKQIEVLARNSSVNLESFRLEKVNLQGEPERKEIQEVSFSLTLSGNYQNLKNFLNSLDNLRRIILVEGFSFKSKKSGNISSPLTLAIEAKAYFLSKN